MDSQAAPPNNVIDLDDHRPWWRVGYCRCGLCGHRWIGTLHPECPVYGLECSRCAQMAGVECGAWDVT